ncbi:UNVERIFIED_CONTAM: hypothetical protein FKN15_043019 [Acipenser sinensis]
MCPGLDGLAVHSRVSRKPDIQEGGRATIPEVVALICEYPHPSTCGVRVGFTGIAHKNGAEMDATLFAAMMDLLRRTLTVAVQGAARPAGPAHRLQRPTKMTAEDQPDAYLEVFEVLATSAPIAGWRALGSMIYHGILHKSK